MDLKKIVFVIFLLSIIFFPFLFSKKEIQFQKEINLPNFIIENGNFKTYNKNLDKKGNFEKLNFYKKDFYKVKKIKMLFFENNNSLSAKKIVYNGIYNFYKGTYITSDYKYKAEKGTYNEKNRELISSKFEFFNKKIDGKGKQMRYKNNKIEAQNILYIIKDIDE